MHSSSYYLISVTFFFLVISGCCSWLASNQAFLCVCLHWSFSVSAHPNMAMLCPCSSAGWCCLCRRANITPLFAPQVSMRIIIEICVDWMELFVSMLFWYFVLSRTSHLQWHVDNGLSNYKILTLLWSILVLNVINQTKPLYCQFIRLRYIPSPNFNSNPMPTVSKVDSLTTLSWYQHINIAKPIELFMIII